MAEKPLYNVASAYISDLTLFCCPLKSRAPGHKLYFCFFEEAAKLILTLFSPDTVLFLLPWMLSLDLDMDCSLQFRLQFQCHLLREVLSGHPIESSHLVTPIKSPYINSLHSTSHLLSDPFLYLLGLFSLSTSTGILSCLSLYLLSLTGYLTRNRYSVLQKEQTELALRIFCFFWRVSDFRTHCSSQNYPPPPPESNLLLNLYSSLVIPFALISFFLYHNYYFSSSTYPSHRNSFRDSVTGMYVYIPVPLELHKHPHLACACYHISFYAIPLLGKY